MRSLWVTLRLKWFLFLRWHYTLRMLQWLSFHLLLWIWLLMSVHLLRRVLISILGLNSSVIKCINPCTCTTMDFPCRSSHSFWLARHQTFCSLINVVKRLVDLPLTTHSYLIIFNLVRIYHMVLVEWIFKSCWHLWCNHILWCVIPQFISGAHTVIALPYVVYILISLLHMLSCVVSLLWSSFLLSYINGIWRRLGLFVLRFFYHLGQLIRLLLTLLMLFFSHLHSITIILTMHWGVTIYYLLLLLWRNLFVVTLYYLLLVNLRLLHVPSKFLHRIYIPIYFLFLIFTNLFLLLHHVAFLNLMRIERSQDLTHLIHRWINFLWRPFVDDILKSIVVHARNLNRHPISSRWHSALGCTIVIHRVNTSIMRALYLWLWCILLLTIVKGVWLSMMINVSCLYTRLNESWWCILGNLMVLLFGFILKVLLIEMRHLIIVLFDLLLMSRIIGYWYFTLITCPSHTICVIGIGNVLLVWWSTNWSYHISTYLSWARLWNNDLSFGPYWDLSFLCHIVSNHISSSINVLVLSLILVLLNVVHVHKIVLSLASNLPQTLSFRIILLESFTSPASIIVLWTRFLLQRHALHLPLLHLAELHLLLGHLLYIILLLLLSHDILLVLDSHFIWTHGLHLVRLIRYFRSHNLRTKLGGLCQFFWPISGLILTLVFTCMFPHVLIWWYNLSLCNFWRRIIRSVWRSSNSSFWFSLLLWATMVVNILASLIFTRWIRLNSRIVIVIFSPWWSSFSSLRDNFSVYLIWILSICSN